KVWSYNPEIANPHWIYPGNLVRFFPAGEEGPSRVEVGNAPQEMQEDENVQSPEMMEEGEDGQVHVSGRIAYMPKNAFRVQKLGFVTKNEVDEAGSIVDTFANQLMLSWPENVYVKFKRPSDARVGDNYVIFHTEREITHPILGGHVGYLTKIDGTAKIVAVDKNVATAQIVKSYSDIEVGFLVGPFGEQLGEYVAPKPNDREMKGYVVASEETNLQLLGEHHYVIVDRGTADGVQAGNTFTIVRNGHGTLFHPNEEQNSALPTEAVGTCMAINVKDKASTCLIIHSIREIIVGDRVEMRAAARTAAR
ncbi:MAG: peptidoglycan-binding protein, partial [Myxococcaceae bacterium]